MSIQTFVLDDATKEEVHDFVINFLSAKTVERVFGGKDISGIKDAKELLESAFSEMDRVYKPKKENIVETTR